MALYSNQEDLILNAFWNLMKEKPADQISVDELSRNAEMSRRTFYRHFKSIEDVFRYILQDRVDYFIRSCERAKPEDFASLAKIFFDFWHYEKSFLNILKKSDKLDLFLQFFLVQARDVMAKFFPVQNEQSRYKVYVTLFIMGGLCGILVKWLEDGAMLNPEDMVQITAEVLKTNMLKPPNPQQRS